MNVILFSCVAVVGVGVVVCVCDQRASSSSEKLTWFLKSSTCAVRDGKYVRYSSSEVGVWQYRTTIRPWDGCFIHGEQMGEGRWMEMEFFSAGIHSSIAYDFITTWIFYCHLFCITHHYVLWTLLNRLSNQNCFWNTFLLISNNTKLLPFYYNLDFWF